MDVRQKITWLSEWRERENRKRIIFKLDLSEIINYAYVGSQAGEKGKENKGAKIYRLWREKLFNTIIKVDKMSWWDYLRKQKKRKSRKW